MNVKLTLTVPVEEVQQEVQEILEDCEFRIKLLSEELNKIQGEYDNPLKQIDMIEILRKKLTVVDLKLEDSYSILSGFIKYKASKDQENDGTTDQKRESNKNSTE